MIYLIDDQEAFLNAFKLEYKDKVKTFNHPNTAFLSLLSERPSVLITDVFMPMIQSPNLPPQGMDGLTLASLVQSVLPEMQVIVISGNERSEIERQFPGQLANIKYFFKKPLDDSFHETVKKLSSQHGFTEVLLALRPEEVDKVKKLEGDSLSEKIINLINKHNVAKA